jgi:hypothetical protein
VPPHRLYVHRTPLILLPYWSIRLSQELPKTSPDPLLHTPSPLTPVPIPSRAWGRPSACGLQSAANKSLRSRRDRRPGSSLPFTFGLGSGRRTRPGIGRRGEPCLIELGSLVAAAPQTLLQQLCRRRFRAALLPWQRRKMLRYFFTG